jgi:hypothetical protein
MTIYFANVNVSGFVRVGVKLLNTETLLTRCSTRKTCMNIQEFSSVRLAAPGTSMTKQLS